NRTSGSSAELLQKKCEHADRARHVARELLQPRRLFEVDEDEFIDAEMWRQPDLRRIFMRRNLVEIARKAMAASVFVAQHLSRFEERAQLVVEIESVDDFDLLRFTHTSVRRSCCR